MGNSSREKKQKQKFVMTPAHPLWEEFYERLNGPEGCDFRPHPTLGFTFICKGGDDRSMATNILRDMGADVEASLDFFSEHGGSCDCEVILNVTRNAALGW